MNTYQYVHVIQLQEIVLMNAYQDVHVNQLQEIVYLCIQSLFYEDISS